MDKVERVRRALRGEPVDRVPASFWFHFPADQRAAHAMAQAHLTYYRSADPDFLKVMNDNYYDPAGVEEIRSVSDWSKLRPAPLSSPAFQNQLAGLRELSDAIGDETFLVTTIFNPYMNGDGISEWKLAEHLKADPESVSAGLATIADSLADFARACVEAGAAGIFFAAQGGEANRRTLEEFERYIKPHDLVVLRAARDSGASFNLLHICGEGIRLEAYADYPAHAVNWATQLNNLSLANGRRLFRRTVVGGVDQRGPIVTGSRKEIAAEVGRAIVEMGTTGLMIGAGCTVPSETPIERLVWAREAVAQVS